MTKIKPSSNEAIIEAAFQLFNEKPGASLTDVAQRAGVGRATLHRHFKSRDTLMVALARTAQDELNEAVETAVAGATTHSEGLKLSLAAIIPLANRQWFLAHEPVDADPEVANAYKADLEELEAEIDAAKEEGTFSKDVPTKWIVQAYENLTYSAWALVRDGEATPNQAADLAWRTLTEGLKGTSK